ncbi:MAG TPA: LssY C-terminal domain-containing protein [Candidatus Saccharibacteria bacterium]|nr:LssY C-terminal domain-containing protein [Candidatus Saccharibacteria bacterium]
MKHIWSFGILLKRLAIFIISVSLVFFIYSTLLPEVWRRDNVLISLIILWLMTAYFVMPRIHRLLSKIYVPDNFIGRTRTVDGLLCDPVNMAINGSKKGLIKAMEGAGWTLAEQLSVSTVWRMMKSVALRRSYPSAPVSDAILFGKKQDFTFQMEVENNPRKRHHVRFWKTPRGWYLPGGYKVDWLGAATYDESVGLSLFTMQFTHSIDSNVDKERDFIISTLKTSGQLTKAERIEHFFSAYKTRNGFGHHYITDGSMVIAELINHKPNRK